MCLRCSWVFVVLCKFTADFDSENIFMKVGQYLIKLGQTLTGVLFTVSMSISCYEQNCVLLTTNTIRVFVRILSRDIRQNRLTHIDHARINVKYTGWATKTAQGVYGNNFVYSQSFFIFFGACTL